MAAKTGRTRYPLIEELISEPWNVEFFQAVRLIEQCAAEHMLEGEVAHVYAVGHDSPPEVELLRFRALPSHTFPPGEITSLKPLSDSPGESGLRFEMVVPFFGLTGPSGVLPHHYTQLLIDRIRDGDFALRNFFDIFNHRMLSLFYRAWEKYRFHVGYEKKSWQVRTELRRGPVEPDESIALFERCLYSIVGLGTPGLRGRLVPSDEAFLHYAGLFAQSPRNGTSLEQIIGDYFHTRASVVQFVGQWLYLDPADQSSLPSRVRPQGLNTALGVNALVGDRVWSIQDKFRVRLGPLDYESFCSFMPTGDRLRPLAQLVRTFVGPEFDFDVQPVLLPEAVPPTQLGADSALGWNTWLLSKPKTEPCDDAVFGEEGQPSPLAVV